ncbi:MAG: siroheme synthase [Sphingomonadales bacterium]|nr:siroheme synthase [Sphingomonadales bacterium]
MTMPALPLFHILAGKPVIVLGSGEAADAKRRLVERAGGRCADEPAPARLAFVAPAPGEFDPAPAVARLRARGILVNCVDRPELCDFTTPALVDRAPVLVAIGTAGASAGLAKALRLRFEALLPQRLGALAEVLRMMREELRHRWPDAGDRRRALDLALAEGGVLDPLADGAESRAVDWLANGTAPRVTRHHLTLASPDPDDLTLRAARLLGSADVIAHGADVPAAILDRGRADALRCGLGAIPETGMVVVLTMR